MGDLGRMSGMIGIALNGISISRALYRFSDDFNCTAHDISKFSEQLKMLQMQLEELAVTVEGTTTMEYLRGLGQGFRSLAAKCAGISQRWEIIPLNPQIDGRKWIYASRSRTSRGLSDTAQKLKVLSFRLRLMTHGWILHREAYSLAHGKSSSTTMYLTKNPELPEAAQPTGFNLTDFSSYATYGTRSWEGIQILEDHLHTLEEEPSAVVMKPCYTNSASERESIDPLSAQRTSLFETVHRRTEDGMRCLGSNSENQRDLCKPDVYELQEGFGLIFSPLRFMQDSDGETDLCGCGCNNEDLAPALNSGVPLCSRVRRFWTSQSLIQEYRNCSAWSHWLAADPMPLIHWDNHTRDVLCPNNGSSKNRIATHSEQQWNALFDTLYPQCSFKRHFGKRAAFCVKGSFQPLTPRELFAAATTMIFEEDPEWPKKSDWTEKYCIGSFMATYDLLFEVDAEGFVRFSTRPELQEYMEMSWLSAKHLQAFMALICLEQLELLSARVVLRPWHCFLDFLEDESQYPLHRYVLVYWSLHYRYGEGGLVSLPRRLHEIIEAAWLEERAEESLQLGYGGVEDLDLGVHAEVLEIGLRLCEENGFEKLQTIYKQMGAGKAGEAVEILENGFWFDLPSDDLKSPTGRSSLKSEPADKDPFDFGEWQLVEPMDLQ